MVFIRLIFTGILVLGLIEGLSFLQPQWFTALGMDFWNLPALNENLATQQERGKEIDEAIKGMEVKSKRKNQMLQDLIQQEISLCQAITITRQTTEPEVLEFLMNSLNIESDNMETAVGALVIYWVRRELSKNPSLADKTCLRLENELLEIRENCPSEEYSKVIHLKF